MDEHVNNSDSCSMPPSNIMSTEEADTLSNASSSASYTVPLPLTDQNIIKNAHIENVQQFSKDLSAAVQAIWPTRHESRYSDVQVLILSWEDDDLGVYKEIDELKRTFRELYKYKVSEWTIPWDKPERRLNLKVGEFLEEHDDKDHLLIVYYAGHGFLNEQRIPMWAAYAIT